MYTYSWKSVASVRNKKTGLANSSITHCNTFYKLCCTNNITTHLKFDIVWYINVYCFGFLEDLQRKFERKIKKEYGFYLQGRGYYRDWVSWVKKVVEMMNFNLSCQSGKRRREIHVIIHALIGAIFTISRKNCVGVWAWLKSPASNF